VREPKFRLHERVWAIHQESDVETVCPTCEQGTSYKNVWKILFGYPFSIRTVFIKAHDLTGEEAVNYEGSSSIVGRKEMFSELDTFATQAEAQAECDRRNKEEAEG